jgi:hypothetical protein
VFEDKIMRNGKIATLPSDIRDQLNWRMENGEQGNDLLAWLNGLPEVKERVKGSLDGRPVSKQNLSQWRLGGFREWHLHNELRHQAYNLTEHAENIEDSVDSSLLAGKMTAILAARYAALLNGWDGAPSPEFEEKLRVLRVLNRDLALLQKTLHQASRHENEYWQHSEAESEKDRARIKEAALAPIQAVLERQSMQKMLELYFPAAARRVAALAASIKYNLPLPKKGRKAPGRQTGAHKAESRKQKAEIARKAASGQSESNLVKPSQTIADCGLRIADCGQNEASGQDESDPCYGTNGTNGTQERDPAGQTESNLVKPPSQSGDSGVAVKPECADGELQTAT